VVVWCGEWRLLPCVCVCVFSCDGPPLCVSCVKAARVVRDFGGGFVGGSSGREYKGGL
jgi:hypothetical protein